jgi:hypothetical protein
VQELRVTARRGFGVAHNEAEPGVTAIAAAIRTGLTTPRSGTVSIAGPTARMPRAACGELAPRVVQCATELSTLVAGAGERDASRLARHNPARWASCSAASPTISPARPTSRTTSSAAACGPCQTIASHGTGRPRASTRSSWR